MTQSNLEELQWPDIDITDYEWLKITDEDFNLEITFYSK
jgi:hypothetical protein